ncbi:MAG: 4-hydroxy-tetrahydrodipicolinate reductase [Rubrivivax sp.]|nr:4-hydroxy-tetrahydrodipicolinate reductase [Rubrivivax sp.]
MSIAVAGAAGRMGRLLVQAVLGDTGLRLSGALDVPGSAGLGQDAGAALGRHSGVQVTADLQQGLAGADVLIDFTRPDGTLAHLAACRAAGVRAVVGTTGFTAQQRAELAAQAQHIGIVFAPNMSVGVNVMLGLLQAAARALDDSYDVEVIEAHHRHKVDAPSGTALALGEAVARGRGVALQGRSVFAREGHTGERRRGDIGFAAIRGGDIVGEHTVLFAGTGERIEITHKSSSRANYAEGSLRAARYVAARGPGLYGMADVLGLPGGLADKLTS